VGELAKDDEIDINFFGSVSHTDNDIFIMNYVEDKYLWGTAMEDYKNYKKVYLFQLQDKNISELINDWTKCIKNRVIVNITLEDEVSEKALKQNNDRVRELCERFGKVITAEDLQCQMKTIKSEYTDLKPKNDFSNLQLNVRVYSKKRHGEKNKIKFVISKDSSKTNKEKLRGSKNNEETFFAYYTNKQKNWGWSLLRAISY
jgi:FKBP-type peptidyl-prolyl cis-trans isomerase (trigger factor)